MPRHGTNNQTCSGIAAAADAASEHRNTIKHGGHGRIRAVAYNNKCPSCVVKHAAYTLYKTCCKHCLLGYSKLHGSCGMCSFSTVRLCPSSVRGRIVMLQGVALSVLIPSVCLRGAFFQNYPLFKKSPHHVKPNIAAGKISPRFVPPRSLKKPFLSSMLA